MPTLSKKNSYIYACIYILTSVNTIIKQKKINLYKTPSLNKKMNTHAYMINMHRITLNMHKMVLLQMVPHNTPPWKGNVRPLCGFCPNFNCALLLNHLFYRLIINP